MDTEYQISSTKLENLPIIDAQCCVNLTTSKNEDHKHPCCPGKSMKRCVLIYLAELLFAGLILCFCGFIIYLTVTSGYFRQAARINETSEQDQPMFIEAVPSRESKAAEPQNLYRYIYSDRLRELSPQLRSVILQIDQSRLKRHVDTSPCQRNMEHCKSVINSMWSIVSIVNNSMPHLQAFLRNVSADTGPSKSKFVELVECLQCKNDSIAFIDESGPESLVDDNRMMYQHTDHAQIKNNVDIVTNLLSNEAQDKREGKNAAATEQSSMSTIASQTTSGPVKFITIDRSSSYESVDASTESIFNGKNHPQESYESARVLDKMARTTSMRTTEYESARFTEAVAIHATNSVPTMTEGTDDTKRTVATVNVTAEPDAAHVREIANAPMHPSVHPSGQGHGEARHSEKEATFKGAARSNTKGMQGRIVSKISLDPPSGTMPTAETIKSTQQLQLTPTMSWMPYQVCFYGPHANGQTKQTAPGQIMYPASSPGASYPISMPQQRQGLQAANQPASSYVQVQANSVQFLPVQQPQANPSYQRVGPTGPGLQNFPVFPGHQTSPSGAGNSARSPYYCTYIPAPTFQFPAIPGVSEYQRSNEKSVSNDGPVLGRKENNTADQRAPPVAELLKTCPSTTIRCGDGRKCILRSQWCNGEVDCYDASDETTCSCRDRISEERLCDGYFDCPHGEDELGCQGCNKTSFSCNDWQRRYTKDNCVSLSQRCDGVKQCANGKDEMDCNILTPSYIEGKNVFTIGYTEGYLHKNFMGQWYPVCTAIDSWAKEACVAEVGPDVEAPPEVKIRTVPDNAYAGPYLAEVRGQIKLVPSCMNTAIYVRCPRFRCGTRILSREDFLRPNILEKEGQNSLGPFDDFLWRFFGNEASQQPDGNDTDTDSLLDNRDEMVGSQLRVVGGRASQPKAWPFLVAIYKDGHFYCGGIILNELWVLTAAHCLDGYSGHYYEIQAGMLRRFSFSPMAQFRKARYTVVHPRYNNEYMKNDIGMIMLDDPLRFNRWVRPVCLPGPDILGSMWRKEPKANSNCVAIGWGAIRERGPDPDHMREVELPVLANCKYEVDQNEATICAGYPQGGRDACQGDSGGPLMCRNPYSESQWYVAGIVSHGEGCARPDEPGTYTRVSYFLNWIQEISSGRGVPPLRRTPLERCPGFSCEGGLGKCLPIEARCNKVVNCLDGEDEVNCHGHYPHYRQMDDTNVISSMEVNSSMVTDKEVNTDSTLIYQTTREPFDTEDEKNNEVEYEERTKTMIISTPSYTEASSPSASTVFPTVFTCTRLLQSIPMKGRCDRTVDCEDGSDEMDCVCKDFLANEKPAAICDGYADCDDLSDEENCTFCQDDEFFCRRSQKCIPMSRRCDVKFDCEYKEDELNCFTLTDGRHVYLDADEQPLLNSQGVLTRYVDANWQPTCHQPRIHNNQSTVTLIGRNMCEYFGFANLQSSESIVAKDTALEMVSWHGKKSRHEENTSAASLSEGDETCSGLYIRCTPVPSANVYTYYRNHVEQWPWLAAISVDGELRCTALLLDRNWLVTAAKCLQNVRLDKNYTVADFGHDVTLRGIKGPHQQTSMIDEIHFVNNSVAVLLHLNNDVEFSRQVRPLFLDRKIYLPGVQDTCEAVGSNERETKIVFVRPILQNCPSCQRCFVNSSTEECSGTETSDWSGTIFCRGKMGWYPAAVFQDNKGMCSFKNSQIMTSIDYINPYLTEVADSPRRPVIFAESSCDGLRCDNGQCVPRNRVCDGIADCRDRADENADYCNEFRANCESDATGCNCARTELRCRDGSCVDKSTFCDGNADCTDGSDEPMICTCAEYLKLTAPERLCDSVRHCLDKTDESPEMCPCRDTSFKCDTPSGNDSCVPQDFVCDGDKDCTDGEDEAECRMLKQFSVDRNSSGEVIARSYGVWHSECLTGPLSSEEDARNLCQSMRYTSGNINNDTEITDDPVIPRRDNFYMVKINSWMWMTLRNDKPLITLVKSNETCHRALVDCF